MTLPSFYKFPAHDAIDRAQFGISFLGAGSFCLWYFFEWNFHCHTLGPGSQSIGSRPSRCSLDISRIILQIYSNNIDKRKCGHDTKVYRLAWGK